MSALARRSAVVMALLFGLLFAVGTAVMRKLQAPAWLAVLFALAVVGLQYALGPWILERIYTIRWVEPEQVHPDFARWYRESCAARQIPVPRFGIIDDGNPNAFTYGHTPRNARVVVTSGLLEMLTPTEVHAVVAHELGHVTNRDFIVMTVASAVPVVLYVLYVFNRGRGRDRGGYAFLVGIGAYLAYLASQYIVLLLSRVREFFADEAAAAITRDPNALSSALVKIAYGLAARQDAPVEGRGKSMTPAGATTALGIASPAMATAFAMSAADAAGRFSPHVLARAMQWDLKNPWAKWFELHSTHPLTARRIVAMNALARSMGQQPAFETHAAGAAAAYYTGNLVLELLVMAAPALCALGGLVLGLGAAVAARSPGMVGLALVGWGVGWLAKIAYSYPRAGAHEGIRPLSGLVGEVNVSHVSPVRCVVEGEIVGRGVPGLFFSDDLVLRDDTGFMTIQYRQPFNVLEFLFGWLKAGRYLGRRARVHGWYRRAPGPYIEIDRVEMVDGAGGDVRCYFVWGNVALAGLLALAGLALMLVLR